MSPHLLTRSLEPALRDAESPITICEICIDEGFAYWTRGKAGDELTYGL